MTKSLSALAIIGALLTLFGGTSRAASICPGLGIIGPGCNEIITINQNGSTTVSEGAYPSTAYDGSDDQLVGVINNSGRTVNSILVTGPDIADFDGDGPWSIKSADMAVSPAV